MSTLGLKTKYLSLNQRVDAPLFFGPRLKIVNELVGNIILTIDTSRVVKKVILGPYGVGKTQLIRYAMSKIKDVAYSVYVETPPCHKRTRFVDLYGVIMRNIGRQYILDILKKTNDVSIDKLQSISDYLGLPERDLGYVIRENLDKNDVVLWRYLTGEKLKAGEVKILKVANNQLYEDDCVWILNALGIIIKNFENKQLILFIDEVENLAVISGDSRMMLTEAIRGLVNEDSNVGIIFVMSARSFSGIPIPLVDEPVMRRIGRQNFVPFDEYSDEDLESLLNDILKFRRIDQNNQDKIAIIKTAETLTNETYPLTKEAITSVIETVKLLRNEGLIDSIRPKEALSIIDDSIAYAIQKDLTYISSDVITPITERYVKSLSSTVIPQ